jgi:hypothetical protein
MRATPKVLGLKRPDRYGARRPCRGIEHCARHMAFWSGLINIYGMTPFYLDVGEELAGFAALAVNCCSASRTTRCYGLAEHLWRGVTTRSSEYWVL